jgi:hypothetical protein
VQHEETRCNGEGRGHRHTGGDAGIAVNLQRICAIACRGLLERAGQKRRRMRTVARL